MFYGFSLLLSVGVACLVCSLCFVCVLGLGVVWLLLYSASVCVGIATAEWVVVF